MDSFLNLIKSLAFGPSPQAACDEAYLAEASDIYDLERRMRSLDQRGRDPRTLLALGLFGR